MSIQAFTRPLRKARPGTSATEHLQLNIACASELQLYPLVSIQAFTRPLGKARPGTCSLELNVFKVDKGDNPDGKQVNPSQTDTRFRQRGVLRVIQLDVIDTSRHMLID